MTSEILAQAEKAQRAAESALARMRAARSFPEFEDAWNELLNALGKVWTRILAACKANQARTAKWRGDQERFRREDPLLRYLHHARNSDQHSVTDAIKHEPGRESMQIPMMPGGTYIKHLEIIGGKVVRYEGNAPLQLKYTPGRLTLLAVTDRGQNYDPPTEHLGVRLARQDPFTVAEFGAKFTAAQLDDLRETIAGPNS